MPGRGFAGRGEDRFGKWVTLTETGGEFEAAHSLSCLILLPTRASEESAHDAFDRKDAGLRDDHAATIEFVTFGLDWKRDITRVHAE